jgi:hypothetical protein
MQDIAVSQLKAGDFKGALETVANIPYEGSRVMGLEKLAVAQAQLGNIKGGIELCDKLSLPYSKSQAAIFKSQALLAVANGLLGREPDPL